jgi:hypothetical protein
LQNDLQNEKARSLLSIGAPGEIRTPDPQIRSLVLCRLQDHFSFSCAQPEQQHYPERTGIRLRLER